MTLQTDVLEGHKVLTHTIYLLLVYVMVLDMQ